MIHNDGKPLDNFFIVQNGSKNDVLYYSLRHSTKVGFYVIASGMWLEKSFGNGKDLICLVLITVQ